MIPEWNEKSIINRQKRIEKNGPDSSFALLSGPFFNDATSNFYRDFMPGFEEEDQMLVIVNCNVEDHCVPENIIKF